MSDQAPNSVPLSFLCSLMIGSTLMTSAPQPFKAAAVASSDAIAAREVAALEAFAKEGWQVPSHGGTLALPGAVAPKHGAAPAKAGSEQGELAELAGYILQNGADEPLNGGYPMALGLADNEEARFDCKQLKVLADPFDDLAMACFFGPQLGIGIVLRHRIHDEFRETWVYRATLDGRLAASVHARRYLEPHRISIPPDEALRQFAELKSWWLSRIPAQQVAGQ